MRHRRWWYLGVGGVLAVGLLIVGIAFATGGRRSGPAPARGFDGDTIATAVLVDLSGIDSPTGKSTALGHQTYWRGVNRSGGVAGRYPVEVEYLDTASDPIMALTRYRSIAEQATMLSSAANLSWVAPELIDRGGFAVAGDRWSTWAAVDRIVLNLAADTIYGQMATAPVWASSAGLLDERTPVAFLAPDAGFGPECGEAFDFARGLMAMNVVYDGEYVWGSIGVAEAVDAIEDADAALVVACLEPDALIAYTAERLRLGLEVPTIVASPAYDTELVEFLGEGDGELGVQRLGELYVMGALAPIESDLPGPAALAADLARWTGADPDDVDGAFVRGYTDAYTAHVLLEAAVELGDLGPIGLEAAANLLSDVWPGWGFGVVELGYGYYERIPTYATTVGVPAPRSERRLGLRSLAGPIQLPALADR